jgi:TonB family protein
MSGPLEREVYRHLASAEERFRAEARSRLTWSTLAAVAVHAAVFFGTPTWISPLTDFVAKPWDGAVDWVVVRFAPAAAADVGPDPGAEGANAPVDIQAEPAEEAAGQAAVGEIAGLSDALFEILLTPALMPTLVQPKAADQGLSDQGGGSGSVQVEGGGASTVMLEGLDAADSLALELLSSLRPELVVLNPSTWILIRNPSVVENFMRTRASHLPDLDGSRRSTSVALWIDETGSVEWAEISQSSGRTDLDELALELFSEVATFRPARDRGVRVPTTAIFTIHFPW